MTATTLDGQVGDDPRHDIVVSVGRFRGTPRFGRELLTDTPGFFRLAVRDLPAGAPVYLQRRHRFDHVSIRRTHPGPHRIDIRVNGQHLGGTTIDVTL